MIGIYKITSPDGKVYIGQSKNIESRWNNYKNLQFLTYLIKQSFDVFGVHNHTFEVVELCDRNMLNERERYYQDLYNSCGDNGLNCLLTKTDDKPQVLRQETKDRIKQTFASKPNQHFASNQQLVLNIETGVYYDSVTLAAESLGITQSCLNNNLTGKTDFNKYPIIYANPNTERDSLIEKRRFDRINNRPKRKIQTNYDSTIIFNTASGVFYNSVNEAAAAHNLKRSTLSMKLLGVNRNNTNLIYA